MKKESVWNSVFGASQWKKMVSNAVRSGVFPMPCIFYKSG